METIQKISKTYTKEKLVNNYYSIISVLNDLKLTPMEINLLSFTAIRGGITNPAAKQEFCEKYDSNPGTIYNCISKLTRKGLFIKKGNKISIHPSLLLEFNNLTLNICMKINPVI